MTTETTKIRDKSGKELTEEQVREKLKRILENICITNLAESSIARLFREKCEVKFPDFQSVNGSWYTRPMILNVYFKGHSGPIHLQV